MLVRIKQSTDTNLNIDIKIKILCTYFYDNNNYWSLKTSNQL